MLAAYAVAAAWHLNITPSTCSTVAAVGIGDGTSGGVWLSWLFDTNRLAIGRGASTIIGAPTGQQIWGPAFYTQLGLEVPTWIFTRVTNAVCAVNLTSILLLSISGFAMYWCCRELTQRPGIAVIAGYLYAFSPFALQKSTGHLAYLNLAAFPIIVLMVVRASQRAKTRDWIICGAAVGSCAITDPYFIPFAWMLFAGLFLSLLFVVRKSPNRNAFIAMGIKSGALGLALQIPVVLLQFTGSGAVGRPLGSPLDEMDTYGARPQDFVAPLWSRFEGLIAPRKYFEASLYLGAIPLLFLAVAIVLLAYRKRAGLDPTRASVMAVLLGVALVLAYFSGPARPHVGSVEIPNPVGIAVNYVPQWRVFARLGIVVAALVLLLGALAASSLLDRLPRRAWLLILIPVVILGAVDREPLKYAVKDFDFSRSPPVYKWLRSEKEIKRIAEYPMGDPEVEPDSKWATFQIVHGKSMVNPRAFAGYEALPAMAALGLGDPQTVPLLRAFDVDAVVVRREPFAGTTSPLPPGLNLERSFEGPVSLAAGLGDHFDADVYRIDPSVQPAPAALIPGPTWEPPAPQGYTSLRWATTNKGLTLHAFPLGSVTDCTVQLNLLSFARPTSVTVTSGKKVLTTATVQTSATPVSFTLPCKADIVLSSSEPPVSVASVSPESTDPRSLGIGLVGASAVPASSP
jgi:hypothetical protein